MPSFGLIPVNALISSKGITPQKDAANFLPPSMAKICKKMEEPTPRTTEEPAQNMEDPTIMEWMNPLQEQNNTLLNTMSFPYISYSFALERATMWKP